MGNTRFDPNKNYRISVDTTKHLHLGMTKSFKIRNDKSFAAEEREEILNNAIKKGLIKEVAGIVFTIYEVKESKLGNYLDEVK